MPYLHRMFYMLAGTRRGIEIPDMDNADRLRFGRKLPQIIGLSRHIDRQYLVSHRIIPLDLRVDRMLNRCDIFI